MKEQKCARSRNPGHQRILPPRLFFITLLVQVASGFILGSIRIISWPWNLAGAALIAAGIIIVLIADRQFKRARTPVCPYDAPTMLVTDGAFAFTRNPMYLGMVTVVIGVALGLGTVVPFLFPLLFGWLLSSRFIGAEEALLSEQFGLAYQDYVRRVRRWL